jgi:glutathione-regulated potassium-efflux system ancillary protein KefC
LLLGLFFISVGMSVNLDVVADSPWQVLGMAMFATLVKLIYQRGLAHVFVLPRSQSWGFSAVLSQVGEFAFVLFGAAAALGILSPTQSGQLIAATALTMLLSPLVLILQAKWDARSGSVKPPEDKIENEHPEVMIAGFGRFGQIVGRLLFARGLRATVVDHEPDQIELLRQFGFKVYYGDATRLELLEAAGLREAKVLVVAIDDPAEALKLVDLVQKEFPEVKIYSRARNLRHLYDLMDRKLAGIERETFEASLSLGRKVLVGLGVNPHEAWQATNQFRRHNYDMIEDLHQLRNDRELMVAKAKQSRADLEQMFQRDQSSLQNPDAHW